MSDIVPCPFCGDSDPTIDEIDMGIWAVCCNDCMTIGPHQDGKQSAEEAIKKWNARVARMDWPITWLPMPDDGTAAGIQVTYQPRSEHD